MKYASPRMVAACLALSAAACDSLATGGFRPPYFTIAASIETAKMTPPESDLRVALLWNNIESPGANYADQLLDVSSQLLQFQIEVRELPAAGVRLTLPADKAVQYGLDPNMQWSVGTIVLYSDDGDGKLDVTSTPGSSGDVILAASTDVDLFYLAAGKPAPPDFIGLFPTVPSFSLVRQPPRPDEPDFGACDSFDANGHLSKLCEPVAPSPPTLVAGGETLQLTLVDPTTLAGYTCASYWGPFDYPDWYKAAPGEICDGGPDVCRYCRGYQCPIDLPATGDVECAPDRLSYRYKRCEPDASLCNTRFCHYGHGERLAGEPAPAGWPCP